MLFASAAQRRQVRNAVQTEPPGYPGSFRCRGKEVPERRDEPGAPNPGEFVLSVQKTSDCTAKKTDWRVSMSGACKELVSSDISWTRLN